MRQVVGWFARMAVAAALVGEGAGCCPKPPGVMGVLLFAGGEGHDDATLPSRLAERLTGRGEMVVEIARDFSMLESPALGNYRVLVFSAPGEAGLSEAARSAIVDHLRSGGGLVAMHAGLIGFRSWPEWAGLVGGVASGHDRPGRQDYMVPDPQHAAVLGIGGWLALTDTPYLIEKSDPAVQVLVRTRRGWPGSSTQTDAGSQPRVWTRSEGDGRVFAIAFGHDQLAQSDEWFITLLHNGIRWAAGALPDTPHNALSPAERSEGYELLFNGKDLTGWTGAPECWSVEAGELVGRADRLHRSEFLTTKAEYGDFVFCCSVCLPDGQGSGGIVFRGRRLADGSVQGYEAGIGSGRYGTLSEEGDRSGVLVEGVVLPDGWNEIVVRATGPRLTLTLNGLTTARYEQKAVDALPARGPVSLELRAKARTEVRFRDIRIRQLETGSGSDGPLNAKR